MPLFSVIVPIYNVRQYVADALKSVAEQSFIDFEAIVVDDGSTDGSGEIAEAFCLSDSRFKYVRQENGGASVARNVGTSMAGGAFIYYMDGDDLLVEDALEVCSSELSAHEADIVLFCADVFPTDAPAYERYREYYRRPQIKSPLSSDEFVIESLKQNRYFVSPCCFVARRFVIGAQRFIEGVIYEDNHFFAALMLNKKLKVAVSSRSLFLRRLRPNSVMSSERSMRNYESLYRLVREMSALSFVAVESASRARVKADLIGGMLRELHFTSAILGAGLDVRLKNLKSIWHVARRVDVRLLTIKRLLFALFPELYLLRNKR
ncbi:glycosyltransferase family 2 protein [Paraburkholderia sediminicola]|uniref:glycosyltransferase family 2 protein n=1 Tax=Paraburkholderia sediminicola TaxID=458836 RepID=UPI0038B8DE9D